MVIARQTLKPCPFCGGKARLEQSHRAFINSKSTKVAFVYCTECNARSGRVNLADYGCTSHSDEACQKVVEAWNRREEPKGDALQ